MTMRTPFRTLFPRQAALLALGSALCVSAAAQQPANGTSTPPSAAQPSPGTQSNLSAPPKEGFWGKVNPFARKKWVNRQLDPVKGQLNELNEVNAKNANDIKDVDGRAQAGIQKAQSTADAAGQAASAARQQAQQAGTTAAQARARVDQLHGAVDGLDRYSEKQTVSIAFRSGSSVLTAADRKQLDDLAASLTGRQGYLLEVEAHAPGSGGTGIQNSEKLAEAVKRYLVAEHNLPVYRMHSVALGNAPSSESVGGDKAKPVRTSYVELRLMENSLAAQDGSTPRFHPSQTGAAQP